MTERVLTYAEAIREALDISLQKHSNAFIIGEGVPDPGAIFGSTKGLKEKYPERVLDMPLSENGLTGMCIGSAITGLRPIMTHQRVDFALYSLDQIINNAAKWHYMFNGLFSVPIVIRMVIGRGWGQGPQHSQNLQALFSHIPGLKVVMPTTPYDAKGLLISAIEDNNPVIFLEHRWLHNIKGNVPEGYYNVPIGSSKIIKQGKDITLACTSYMSLEALKASEMLSKLNISPEIIDIRTLSPLNYDEIINSVKKTGHLIVCDLGNKNSGFASEVITRVAESAFQDLKSSPKRITSPDFPVPTSPALANHYYPLSTDIAKAVLEKLKKPKEDFDYLDKISKERFKDVLLDLPDPNFTGPF